jgi:hypothetical protein
MMPEDLIAPITKAWLLVLALLVLGLKGVATGIATSVMRACLLRVTVGALTQWTCFYTAFLDEEEREIRRADFQRDLLWRRYRRLRRRGHQAPEIAMLLLTPVVRDIPTDLYEAVTSACEWTWRRTSRFWRRYSPMRRWTDRGRLERALAVLAREHGYFVTTDRERLACCSSCAWTDVPEGARGAVLWCIQGDGYAFDGDAGYCDDEEYSVWLQHSLYMQWTGNGRLIVKTLRSLGFDVRWNGRRGRAIAVLPSPLHADPSCTSEECRPQRSARRRRMPAELSVVTQSATGTALLTT